MTKNVRVATIAVLLAISCSATLAQEAPGKFDIGLRGSVLLGDGVPANDILGFGVIARYRLNKGWFLGAGIDRYEYDFEHPAKLVGLVQDPNESDIDAAADSTVINFLAGKLYNETDHGFDWFWSAGIGFTTPNVDDVSGPTDTGGMFDITFDVGSEIHVMGTIGTSYNFSSSWSTSFSARIEHHFMDILVTDRVTGNTAQIDSQTPIGAYISLNYKF